MRRKRPPEATMLLAVSVVLAAAATLILRGHLAGLEARAAASGPGTPVVLAATDLDRGTVLGSPALEVGTVPQRYRPPGAVSSVADASGRTLSSAVAAGEAITESRLAPPGGPVAAVVPPGLRAVSVVVAAPPGPLVAGDRVDVLATYAGGQPHTETVVAAAEVLTGVTAGEAGGFGEAATVIVLVAPSDAERLAFARSLAELSLAVVSSEEVP